MPETESVVSSNTTLGRFIRFVCTSLISGVAIDKGVAWLLYNLLRDVMGARHFRRILIANIIARVLSLATNYLLNQRFVFASDDHGKSKSDVPTTESLPRYFVLASGMLMLSTIGVWWISGTFGISEVLAKFGVDFVLFFVNYLVQTNWVFSKPDKGTGRLSGF